MGDDMKPNKYDRYWRLRNYTDDIPIELGNLLKGTAYPIGVTTTRETLYDYLRRNERGFLCYHGCSKTELLQFIQDRQIVTDWHGLRAKDLACHLETADNNLTFAKFLNLPPELRSRIYDFYVAAFPCILEPCAQPPFARTCKLVRNELLPLLYSTRVFELSMDKTYDPVFERICFTLDSDDFLARLAPENMAEIRSVRLDNPCNHTCQITLTKDRSDYSIVYDRDPYAMVTKTKRNLLHSNIGRVLEKVCSRTQSKGFTVDDIYAIRLAIQDVHNLPPY